MSNMSYCRFENTIHDLYDCMSALEEARDEEHSYETFQKSLSSEYEQNAFRNMEEILSYMLELYEELRSRQEEEED